MDELAGLVFGHKGVDEAEMSRMRWADKAGDRLRKVREKRLEALALREAAVSNGMRTLGGEHRKGTKCDVVLLREAFYRNELDGLEDEDADPARSPQKAAENPGVLQQARADELKRRPRMGRLVNRPGAALPLVLAAVATTQFRGRYGPGAMAGIPNTGSNSWAKIIGDPSKTEPVRKHIASGLERLAKEGLVGLRSQRGRGYQSYDGWELFVEDGTGGMYEPPDSGLEVPSAFWLRGWAAVLTQAEVATYLMFLDAAALLPGAHLNQGVGLAPRTRRQYYGITKEIYAAASELEEFGLLERTTQRRSSVPPQDGQDPANPKEVQRFRIVPEALERVAFEVVSEVMQSHRTPARIAQYDPLAGFDLDAFLLPGTDTSVPATPTLPDQLRALADLHRQGALTNEEFDAAKRKLLRDHT
jgi:hypothetical protein